MENTFKHDCMQFNPHLNYLKIPPLLKHSMSSLLEHIQSLCTLISIDDKDTVQQLKEHNENYKSIVRALISFLENVDKLEQTCLTFIELKLIEKYFKQNLLKEEMFEAFVYLGTICLLYAADLLQQPNATKYDIEISFKCADLILKDKLLWNVINKSENSKHLEIYVDVLYKTVNIIFGNTKLMNKFEIEHLDINEASDLDKKAVFLAKFVEIRSKKDHHHEYLKLEVTCASHSQ